MPLILIGGGARSGKSSYALQRARQFGNRLALIATAEPFDAEMQDRINRHRQDRSSDIVTIEEPLSPVLAISQHEQNFDALVIDCLTLWLSNHLIRQQTNLDRECESLVKAAQQARIPVLLVTNEVGCGIVPDTPLGREFRDLAGRLNQMAAIAAQEVYWTIFGVPVRIK